MVVVAFVVLVCAGMLTVMMERCWLVLRVESVFRFVVVRLVTTHPIRLIILCRRVCPLVSAPLVTIFVIFAAMQVSIREEFWLSRAVGVEALRVAVSPTSSAQGAAVIVAVAAILYTLMHSLLAVPIFVKMLCVLSAIALPPTLKFASRVRAIRGRSHLRLAVLLLEVQIAHSRVAPLLGRR